VSDDDEIVLTVDRAGKGVFVTAETGKGPPVAQLVLEALGDHAEKFVTDRVTERVVDS